MKKIGMSRASRRMGTKAPILCKIHNTRVKQWRWKKHLKKSHAE